MRLNEHEEPAVAAIVAATASGALEPARPAHSPTRGHAGLLLEEALRFRERTHGTHDLDLAACLGNLDETRLTRACPGAAFLRRARAICEKVLGADRSGGEGTDDTVSFYSDQAHYVQAERLLQRALAASETALGADHPDVAACLDGLAQVYRAQGRHEAAAELLERVVAIGERRLGPEHPDVAASLNSLALLRLSRQQYALAEPLLQRALEISSNARGADHPDLAANLHNLGALHHGRASHVQAERFYRHALRINERHFGPAHPSVAIGLRSLATLYRDMQRPQLAEMLERRIAAIWALHRESPASNG